MVWCLSFIIILHCQNDRRASIDNRIANSIFYNLISNAWLSLNHNIPVFMVLSNHFHHLCSKFWLVHWSHLLRSRSFRNNFRTLFPVDNVICWVLHLNASVALLGPLFFHSFLFISKYANNRIQTFEYCVGLIGDFFMESLIETEILFFFSQSISRCSESVSKFASCQNSSMISLNPFIDFGELELQLDPMNMNSKPLPLWFNSLMLILFLIVFRSAAYLVLRFARKPFSS